MYLPSKNKKKSLTVTYSKKRMKKIIRILKRDQRRRSSKIKNLKPKLKMNSITS